jgi:hypothetical protein
MPDAKFSLMPGIKMILNLREGKHKSEILLLLKLLLSASF